MATSLLDGLMGLLTPALLSTAGRSLGESEGSVATGLGAAFPTILAGLSGKAGDPPAMRPLFDLINSPANDDSVLRDPRLAVNVAPQSALGGAAGSLLSGLFGSQLSSVGDVIGRTAGLRAGAGGSLLKIAAPLVLGVLGNRVRSGGLDSWVSRGNSRAPCQPAWVPSSVCKVRRCPKRPHRAHRAGSGPRWRRSPSWRYCGDSRATDGQPQRNKQSG
jgi:Bacterial protein of unknown function (DUF937)